MLPIILLAAIVSSTFGQALLPGQQPGLTHSANAVILQKSSENAGDGNFRWSFETSDGTRAEQTGFLKNPDPLNPEGSQAVQGSYSYISPEGIPITVNYIADENGFQPVGDHIPGNNLRQANPAVNPFVNRQFPQTLPTADPSAVAAAAALRRVRPENAATVAPELLNPLNPFYANNGFRGVINPYNNLNGFNRVNPYLNRYNNNGLYGGFAAGAINNRGFPTALENRGFPTALDNRGFPTALDNRGFPTALDNRGFPIAVDNRGFPNAVINRGFAGTVDNRGFPVAGLGGNRYFQ